MMNILNTILTNLWETKIDENDKVTEETRNVV